MLTENSKVVTHIEQGICTIIAPSTSCQSQIQTGAKLDKKTGGADPFSIVKLKQLHVSPSLLLATTALSLPNLAAASVRDGWYRDLNFGALAGSTSPALLDNTSVTMSSAAPGLGLGFGGRIGLGLARDDYYTEINAGLSMSDIANHGYGFGFNIGMTVGMVLETLPVGFNIGFDFLDSYSATDSAFTANGYTVRSAFSYFLQETTKLSLEVCRHTYTSVSTLSTSTTPNTGFTTVAALIGFPAPWNIPKAAWRKPKAHDGFSGRSHSEVAPPPAAEPPPPATEPGPEPAPDALPPAVDPNASNEISPEGSLPPPSDSLAAPPTADPAVPTPDPATVPEGALPEAPAADLTSPPTADLPPPPEDVPAPPSADLPPADLPPPPPM